MIDNIRENEEKFFEYDKILYDAIHKKLKKKNYTYKELCDILAQSPAEGNKKKRHIKELGRYMNLEYNKKTKKYKLYKTVKTNKITVKKLKKGTAYKFKVKAYKKTSSGSITGAVSKTYSVKTKK